MIELAYTGHLLAGVDEAGRGPLAGNVFAAAVILDPNKPIAGLADSKKLSEKKREALSELILENALAYAIAHSTVAEIDDINILQASLLAMQRAVDGLNIQPEYIVVDGNRLPQWPYPSEAIVKGDDKVAAIAAASILAKVSRDRELIVLDKQYPGYGFAQNKAYPSKQHLEAIQRLGITPVHRRSYKPVKNYLAQQSLYES